MATLDNLVERSTGVPESVDQNPSTTNDVAFANITSIGNITPAGDGTSVIGSPTKKVQDVICVDENGTQFSARGLAAGQRRIRDNISVLSYSESSSVVGGVWTYTITDTTGAGVMAFFIGEKVLVNPSSSMSVVLTSYAGTDLNPKDIWIYVQNDGADNPELVASNTRPTLSVTNHADVCVTKAGTVSASSVTIYGSFFWGSDSYEFVHLVQNRFYDQGTIYNSGMAITATSSDVTIGVGSHKTILKDVTTTSVQVSVDGQFYIKSDGTYNTSTGFDYGVQYSDGTAITNNRYFNVVLGVVNDGSTRIIGLVQKGATEYVTISGAFADTDGMTVTVPDDDFLKKLYIPICRIIVLRAGTSYTLQQIPGSTEYYIDLRGTVQSSGSGAGSGSNVVDGNNESDSPFWNATAGEYLPKTTAEAFALLRSSDPFVYARYTSTVSDITGDGTLYQLKPNVVDADNTSIYNSTTGVSTLDKTGWYEIDFNMWLRGITATHDNILTYVYYDSGLQNIRSIQRNPSNVRYPGAGDMDHKGREIFYGVATDTVYIAFFVDNDTKTVDIGASITTCYMSLKYLGDY